VQTYTGTVLTLLLLAEEVLSGRARDSARHVALRCRPSPRTLTNACGERRLARMAHGFPAVPAWPRNGARIRSRGALLLHETAKAAAVGMSSGQFRHGPAEILSGDFRAVVFRCAPGTQALDRSLADDLFSVGAKVRWIGLVAVAHLTGSVAGDSA